MCGENIGKITQGKKSEDKKESKSRSRMINCLKNPVPYLVNIKDNQVIMFTMWCTGAVWSLKKRVEVKIV